MTQRGRRILAWHAGLAAIGAIGCQSPGTLQEAIERASRRTGDVVAAQNPSAATRSTTRPATTSRPVASSAAAKDIDERILSVYGPRAATSGPATRDSGRSDLAGGRGPVRRDPSRLQLLPDSPASDPSVAASVKAVSADPARPDPSGVDARSPIGVGKETPMVATITAIRPVRPGPRDDPEGGAANRGLGARSESPAADRLADVIVGLQEELAGRPADQDLRRTLALACVAAGQDDKARQTLQERATDGELDQQFVDALIGWRDAERQRDPARAAEDLLARLDRLQAALADRADLAIGRLALAGSRVDGFGQYDEVRDNRLPAGTAHHLLVYLELSNYRTEIGADKLHHAKLRQRTTVLTPAGKVVWQEPQETRADECRSRRRDFFTTQRLLLPASLPPGEYVLKVAVDDLLASKSDEKTLTFRLVPPDEFRNDAAGDSREEKLAATRR